MGCHLLTPGLKHGERLGERVVPDGVRENEVGAGQTPCRGFVGHGSKSGFYSNCCGECLRGFRQECDVIYFNNTLVHLSLEWTVRRQK